MTNPLIAARSSHGSGALDRTSGMNARCDNAASILAAFDKEAYDLRGRAAQELAHALGRARVEPSTASHYEAYSDVLPLPSGRSALAFNDAVTDHVLRRHVLTCDDAFRTTYLAAKVIEQTFYQFFDPKQPDAPIKNLAVAKHYGTFFTPHDIASLMAAGLGQDGNVDSLLDPCVGSGVLLCAALLQWPANRYARLVGIELDGKLAQWASEVVARVATLVGYDGHLQIDQGDGLDYLLELPAAGRAGSFDIIINPPYGRLRFTADRATNDETAFVPDASKGGVHLQRLQRQVAEHAKQIRNRAEFFAGEKGILELSRVYFRACAENANVGARVSIITPDAWLCGNDGVPLRAFLCNHRLIERVVLIREDGRKFSTVNQATAITFLAKGQRDGFALESLHQQANGAERIEYSDLISAHGRQMVIPRIAGRELGVFKKLHSLRTFGQVNWITNARGEVDQTMQKAMFQAQPTDIRLVRGEHLERCVFRHASDDRKPGFLVKEKLEQFLAGKPKAAHFDLWRIAGRQCSYAQQKRRLVFALVPPRHALGNSCNYLAISNEGGTPADHTYLVLGLLSSATLDWYFRATNSNNHVGNYEIDAFPFPATLEWAPTISAVVRQLIAASTAGRTDHAEWLQLLLEALVGLSYELVPETELRLVVEQVGDCDVERVVNFANHLSRGVRLPVTGDMGLAFNHSSPSLSALDKEIISHVPEGGNWQNIPEAVPSERLKQIRAMTAERGVVRTTYYGRLRRDQPAYTVNTYFNRPGNGTHIHPILDRTLTCREAARLQSFPDNYLFAGSEGAIRDQIGNAVPPLLAQAIGNKLRKFRRSGLCVDVFCGAGGLSLGLESAGWEIVAAIDYNREALDTYALNRPSDLEPAAGKRERTALYRRDLQDRAAFEDVLTRIARDLGGRELDLLVGGPPCQGFSHAGFRLADDKRNDLASIYLHMAECLRPRMFVLENVEGLLTFKRGQVLRDIRDTLRELGYRVADPVWRLGSEQYGVPQMRRRVFVVATLEKSVDLEPPNPTHERCGGRRDDKQRSSLFDPVLAPPVTVAEALAGLSLPTVDRGTSFGQWIKGPGFTPPLPETPAHTA